MFKNSLARFSILAIVIVLALSQMAFTLPDTAITGRGGPGGRNGQGGSGMQQGSGQVNSGVSPSGNGQGNGGTTAGTGYVLTPLTDAEKDALTQAILEEYGALNLYQSVIDQFGQVYPFTQIVLSEQKHVDALTRQAVKYGVTVPANPGLSTAPVFATLSDACAAGVDAEIADAALYDTLKPLTTHTDLLRVYNNLQRASLKGHLPSFEACK